MIFKTFESKVSMSRALRNPFKSSVSSEIRQFPPSKTVTNALKFPIFSPNRLQSHHVKIFTFQTKLSTVNSVKETQQKKPQWNFRKKIKCILFKKDYFFFLCASIPNIFTYLWSEIRWVISIFFIFLLFSFCSYAFFTINHLAFRREIKTIGISSIFSQIFRFTSSVFSWAIKKGTNYEAIPVKLAFRMNDWGFRGKVAG